MIFLLVLIKIIGIFNNLIRESVVLFFVLEFNFVIIELFRVMFLLNVFVIFIMFWFERVLVIKKILCGLVIFFMFFSFCISFLFIESLLVVLIIIKLKLLELV